MPVAFDTFQAIAQQSFHSVVIGNNGQNGQENNLIEANRIRFGRTDTNHAIREAFKEALTTQFGEKIADSLKYDIDSSRNLSSRQIRTVIQEAQEKAVDRVLAQFSQMSMKEGLPHPALVNMKSVGSLATHLVNKAISEGTSLSDDAVQAIARQVLDFAQRAGQRPRGVELLNQERYEYNVEDRAKMNDLKPRDRLGPFEFIRLKQKGVEPGFEAHMAWEPKHSQEMKTDGTQFNRQARNFLERALENNLVLTEGTKNQQQFTQMVYITDEIQNKTKDYLRNQEIQVDHSMSLARALQDQPDVMNNLITHLMNDPEIVPALQKHIQENDPYFTSVHYVKMDYAESDRGLRLSGHKVRIPSRTAKGVLHRLFTAKTRAEANQAALKETLATDLMQAMGITSQKARLVPASYASGKLKLMVEAEHMSMVDNEGQKLSFKDFSGNLRDGILTKEEDGNRVSDPAIEQWGRNKILLLLMADRDAIGSRGDNKGRMGNTFAAIDPGHSLEGYMSLRNIHSDFSFDQPSFTTKGMKFKNFTMFDDSSFAEKMEGIRQLVNMRNNGDDLRVFDSYENWVDTELAQQHLTEEMQKEFQGMKDQIQDMKKAFIDRRDYILDEVFGERIKFMDANPPVLHALDALEKLTSPTRMTSPSGDITLRHPQVEDGKRQEWHIASDGNNGYTFSTTGSQSVVRALTDFLQNQMNPMPEPTRQNGKISLHIPDGQLQNFMNAMNEQNVIAAKHGAH